MKPDWDKLMKKYDGHDYILIADVDCTGDGKSLCATHGVQGYPTLKYGDPANLESYEGGRDYDDLYGFIQDFSAPCTPDHLDQCAEDDRIQIENFQAMSLEELENTIAKVSAKLEAVRLEFKMKHPIYEAEFNAASAEKTVAIGKNDKLTENIGLAKGVLVYKEKLRMDEAGEDKKDKDEL